MGVMRARRRSMGDMAFLVSSRRSNGLTMIVKRVFSSRR